MTAETRVMYRRPAEKMVDLGDIVGAYRLEKELGRGGCGRVYRATHALLGRTVALKILHEDYAEDAQFVSRFFHEAKIVNRLRHPNIIDIVDFLDSKDPVYVAYVMEHLEGGPLHQVVGYGVPIEKAARAALQISSALQAVHKLGVVHRDLKPENIFILAPTSADWSAVPSLKVLDFGFAKFAPEEEVGHRTATGLMVGTPAYMAPEQLWAKDVSPATDVYALGELIYEMLAGRPLFMGSRRDLLKQKYEDVAAGAIALPTVPAAQVEVVAGLIRRCLAVDPAERPTLPELDAALRPLAAAPGPPAELRASTSLTPPPLLPASALRPATSEASQGGDLHASPSRTDPSLPTSIPVSLGSATAPGKLISRPGTSDEPLPPAASGPLSPALRGTVRSGSADTIDFEPRPGDASARDARANGAVNPRATLPAGGWPELADTHIRPALPADAPGIVARRVAPSAFSTLGPSEIQAPGRGPAPVVAAVVAAVILALVVRLVVTSRAPEGHRFEATAALPEPGRARGEGSAPAAGGQRTEMASVLVHSLPPGALVTDGSTRMELGRTPINITWSGRSKRLVQVTLEGFYPTVMELDPAVPRLDATLAPVEARAQPMGGDGDGAPRAREASPPAPSQRAAGARPHGSPRDLAATAPKSDRVRPLRRDETTPW